MQGILIPASVAEELAKRMETLREFLDSSTIHGLAHISNPKVRKEKEALEMDYC